MSATKERKLIEQILKANPVHLRGVVRAVQERSENSRDDEHWAYLEGAQILETVLEISEKR